jgi:hypothetical protein
MLKAIDKTLPQKGTKSTNELLLSCAFCALLWLNAEQWLAVFNGLPVLDVNLSYLTSGLRLNLVHEFHGFDDANNRVGFNARSDLHEGVRTG